MHANIYRQGTTPILEVAHFTLPACEYDMAIYISTDFFNHIYINAAEIRQSAFRLSANNGICRCSTITACQTLSN